MTTPDIPSLVESVLPCPFCGKPAKTYTAMNTRIARCEPCGLAKPITEWNARACNEKDEEITRLRAELAEKSAWQEEIRGAIDRSGMGIMRTSQGPIGTMIGYRPEVEEEHDRKTLEVIHENVDLTVEVRDLKKELAEEKRKVEVAIRWLDMIEHATAGGGKGEFPHNESDDGYHENAHECALAAIKEIAALTTPSEGG